MENALEWINKNYPTEGVFQRKEDTENYDRAGEEIINLEISNQSLEGYLGINLK